MIIDEQVGASNKQLKEPAQTLNKEADDNNQTYISSENRFEALGDQPTEDDKETEQVNVQNSSPSTEVGEDTQLEDTGQS
ncbi:hypothetical protein A2U01_0083778, partial [Trifolium medium]|nr:hypothetical protein [Trifolium medium]